MSALLTAFAYHTERIDGREVTKPLPKNLHAFIQDYLCFFFRQNLPKELRAAPELNVICGDDRLVPDVTVMYRDACYADGDLIDPPILAVEILSPGQTIGDLLIKADRLLKAGTPLCWIIHPERRQAWSYSVDTLDEATAALTASLSNCSTMTLSLAAMWAELD